MLRFSSLFFALALASGFAQGQTVSMSTTGSGAALIKGPILLSGFRFNLEGTPAPQPGAPVSKPPRQVFIFTKPVDKTSLYLYNVADSKAVLNTVDIKIAFPVVDGHENQNYSLTLTHATIDAINTRLDRASNGKVTFTDEIALSYQRIQWSWEEPNSASVNAGWNVMK